MKSEAEVEAACTSRVGNDSVEDYCFPCIECESATCVDGVTETDGYDCTEFLGDAYAECTEEQDSDLSWLLIVAGVLMGIGCCVTCYMKRGQIQEKLESVKGGAASRQIQEKLESVKGGAA